MHKMYATITGFGFEKNLLLTLENQGFFREKLVREIEEGAKGFTGLRKQVS